MAPMDRRLMSHEEFVAWLDAQPEPGRRGAPPGAYDVAGGVWPAEGGLRPCGKFGILPGVRWGWIAFL